MYDLITRGKQMDVHEQAFYVIENGLLSWIAQGDFVEIANNG